jgi:hypothetical protein
VNAAPLVGALRVRCNDGCRIAAAGAIRLSRRRLPAGRAVVVGVQPPAGDRAASVRVRLRFDSRIGPRRILHRTVPL